MPDLRHMFLLRHAKSSWDDGDLGDFDRPLNERGRRNARAMADYLKSSAFRPAIVLCSATLRTRQTWELLAPALNGVPVSFEPDLYEASRHDLVTRLRHLDDHLASALVIGHNPGLQRLANHLCAGHGAPKALARLEEKFPTCTLATLEAKVEKWAELDQGCARLTDFVRPADLK
jgi:phosphohistidine phosphatase